MACALYALKIFSKKCLDALVGLVVRKLYDTNAPQIKLIDK